MFKKSILKLTKYNLLSAKQSVCIIYQIKILIDTHRIITKIGILTRNI